jgi:hypothetical protein
MAKKRGRPKVPPSEYKGRIVQVRVTNAEHRMLAGAAKKDGLRLSEWIRRAIFDRIGGVGPQARI